MPDGSWLRLMTSLDPAARATPSMFMVPPMADETGSAAEITGASGPHCLSIGCAISARHQSAGRLDHYPTFSRWRAYLDLSDQRGDGIDQVWMDGIIAPPFLWWSMAAAPWRSMEDAMGSGGWAAYFNSFVMSIPVDADLLNAANWTLSNRLPRIRNGWTGKFGGWLEVEVSLYLGGGLAGMSSRVDYRDPDEKAAMVSVSADGRTVRFDPAEGFMAFPGGCKKFAIRLGSRMDPTGPWPVDSPQRVGRSIAYATPWR